MVTICEKCGVTGYSELLVYCSKCKTSAEHQYCQDKSAVCDGKKADWLCEQCVPRSFKNASVDTVSCDQRRSTRKLQYQDQWMNCVDIVKIRNRRQRILNAAKLSKLKLKNKNTSGSEDKDASGFHLHSERPSDLDKNSLLEFDGSNAGLPHQEGENIAISSPKHVKNEKAKGNKRKLILPEEDHSEEQVPFSCIDQNVFKEGTSPRLILPDKGQSDEKVPIACIDQNVFKESTRRRLVLPEEDQSDEEVPFAFIDQNVFKETMRRRLILPEEEQSDEEIPFACIDQNVFKESPLQADVCSSETNDPDTAMNRLHLGCVEASKSQAVLHGEALGAQVKISSHWIPTTPLFHLPAQPVLDHVWRGCFDVCNEVYGPLTAHLSSAACEKVCSYAKMLPPVLHMGKLSRLDEWPKSYTISPPTNDHIALYFFPQDLSGESVDQLLDDIMKNDLVLKIVFHESELLIFASVTLPEYCNRFLGKYYLWGTFKARKVPNSRVPEDHAPKSNEITGDKPKAQVSEHREEQESEAPDENSSGIDVSINYTAVKQIDVVSRRTEEVEMKEVDAHDKDSSDVIDTSIDSTSDNSVVLRRQVPAASAKTVHSSKDQNMDSWEHAQSRDSEVSNGEANDRAVDDCLPLFPLAVEDVALMSRGWRSNAVNLELSLGWSGGDDDRCRDCTSKSNPRAKMFLDGAIF